MTTATKTRKPQLGYEPRTYDQIYTPRYMASRSWARLNRRQRGKWAMKEKTLRDQRGGMNTSSAPFGCQYGRRRAFAKLAEMQQARAKNSVYWYTVKEFLRMGIEWVRRERLGVVDELNWIAKHGPYYYYQRTMPHLV